MEIKDILNPFFFFKKSVLSDIQKVKAQGALVRSRFKDIDQMDVPTKYFFSLEKRMVKNVLYTLYFLILVLLYQIPLKSGKEQSVFMKICIVANTRKIRLLSSVFMKNFQRSLKTLMQHSREL